MENCPPEETEDGQEGAGGRQISTCPTCLEVVGGQVGGCKEAEDLAGLGTPQGSGRVQPYDPSFISDDHELIRDPLRMAASRQTAETAPTGRGYCSRTC